jgi:SAM-dependent methyltransferase
VLDLGCGPGQLAIAFGFFAGEVVGVDPEPQMLAVASNAAQGLTPNVRFREGSSFDLDPALGRFRLVTMGRSFHWMDRVDTLRKLDEMIDPEGAVALFGDHHLDVSENEWHREWRTVIDHYAGDDASRGGRRDPSWLSHERVLLASPFAHLERISVIGRHVRSMSSLSRERIGERLDDLERNLKTSLIRAASDGMLTELIEWTVLSGRRY